jgi:hypothetical protein
VRLLSLNRELIKKVTDLSSYKHYIEEVKKTSLKKIIKSLLIMVTVVGSGFVLWSWTFSVSVLKAEEVTWPVLSQLSRDYVPDLVKNLGEKEIKIAGFVVPLTDNFNQIREFLLVPDPMSCIHVPPPPPNQMVLVNLEQPMNSQLAYGPVWVKGKFHVKSYESSFGTVEYRIDGDQVQVYNEKPF